MAEEVPVLKISIFNFGIWFSPKHHPRKTMEKYATISVTKPSPNLTNLASLGIKITIFLNAEHGAKSGVLIDL